MTPREWFRKLLSKRTGRGTIDGLQYGPDDTPLSDEDRLAVACARDEIDRGEFVTREELMRDLAEIRQRGDQAAG